MAKTLNGRRFKCICCLLFALIYIFCAAYPVFAATSRGNGCRLSAWWDAEDGCIRVVAECSLDIEGSNRIPRDTRSVSVDVKAAPLAGNKGVTEPVRVSLNTGACDSRTFVNSYGVFKPRRVEAGDRFNFTAVFTDDKGRTLAALTVDNIRWDADKPPEKVEGPRSILEAKYIAPDKYNRDGYVLISVTNVHPPVERTKTRVFWSVDGGAKRELNTEGWGNSFNNYKFTPPDPEEGQRYEFILEIYDKNGRLIETNTKSIIWGNPRSGGEDKTGESGDEGNGGGPSLLAEPIDIFPPGAWERCMMWYTTLASLSGVFIFLTVVRSGYTQMATAVNPSTRASSIDTFQRCILAVAFIMLAPVFIRVLLGINNEFVKMIAQIANHIIGGDISIATAKIDTASMFEKVLATPFQLVINLINYVFGLRDPNTLIFNGHLHVLDPEVFLGAKVNTNNVLGDVLIKFAFVGFNVYFNAVYTIRRWVVIAVTVATPLIAWIWALSGSRQVLEIWCGEVIQTIFMQTFHALTLGIFLSIAYSKTSVSGIIDISWFVGDLRYLGVWLAGFGGVVCLCVIISLAFRLALAREEKEVAEVKAGFSRALTGLIVLGLSLMIAGVLATILSGGWGIKW